VVALTMVIVGPLLREARSGEMFRIVALTMVIVGPLLREARSRVMALVLRTR
jgi:hypothetical protein